MAKRGSAPYRTGFVRSADGTKIGYRQLGSGPGIILLHGGVNASQHLMRLGSFLADDFTVFIADRRGRGLSGPMGENYSIKKEDEDVRAVVEQTGSRYIFGTANGALSALHAAIGQDSITKVAAYEPLIDIGQPDLDQLFAVMAQYEEELTEGRLGAAMATSIKGAQEPRILARLPRPILAGFFSVALKGQARTVAGDDVALRDLMPTVVEEMKLIKGSGGMLADFAGVSADVLLLFGSKTKASFKDTIEALHAVLPKSLDIEMPGLGHRSAQDYGQPEQLVPVLRCFFGRQS